MSSPGSTPLVRPWLLVVAGVVAILAAALVALTWRPRAVQNVQNPSSPAAARKDRARAAFLVAPAPIPVSLPLMGREGTDADGYPTRFVDRPGLRSLLGARKFGELTSYVEQLQDAFEADPHKEYWPIDAGEAFASAEPELAPELDAWVAASPTSFAPYFARGSHRVARMWAMRGTKFVSETPSSDLDQMRKYGRRALEDLDRALELRPKLVAAMRQAMRVAAATGNDARREALETLALQACGTCVQIRATYLRFRTPRWGGSYEAMEQFVRTIPTAHNPRLRVLAGYEYLDRAELLMADHRYDEALVAIERANKTGDYWEYLVERGRILSELGKVEDATSALNRADALRPMHPEVLSERAYVERKSEAFLPAGRDLLTVLRIEPSNVDAKEDLAWVLNGVLVAAERLEHEGKHEEALRAAELGLELGPLDRQAHGVYAGVVVGDATTPDRIAALQRRVADAPGDFRAVQQLDYALSPQRRFPEILAAWNGYLAVHPEDGRAHMERSGTYWNLGRRPDALADAVRACELGVNEGCVRAAENAK